LQQYINVADVWVLYRSGVIVLDDVDLIAMFSAVVDYLL